jgi:uncharacterized membrane protein YgdD (TMEM256/DUF423 family)
MTKRFLILACISGLTAVIFGAFGAHFLKKILTENHVQIFETGIRYQFYHTFALIATALISRYASKRWTTAAGWLFASGMALFSGSLYLLSVAEFLEFDHLAGVIGPVTPMGGLLLIAGWACLLRASIDYERRK